MILANVSIKRPVFVTVIFLVLLIVGGLCYSALTINDMPQADMPFVTVTIIQRGAQANQIESKVSKEVEEAIGQISGVKHISTTVTEGVSRTAIEFILEKSVDIAAQEVRDKVNSIRSKLPSDIDDPVIVKFDPTSRPIMSLAVTGMKDNIELSKIVDDIVLKRLYTINGVGSVDEYGKLEREVQIKLDKEKMAAFGLTTSEVINSLKSDNLEIPGGKVADEDREISLRTNANVKRVEDFNNILVAKRSSIEIRVRDVADVIYGVKDKESLSYFDGKACIGIDIIKQSGTNTVSVADAVKKEVENIRKLLPSGADIQIVRDNSITIRDSVNEVIKTMIEGCVLAVIIVFLFLRKWQSTLISATSLPTSIITTFIAMKLLNFSLNNLSLMALSLAVGLLIDDAIVVIENIVRHMHMGKSPIKAAKEATSEIGLAVLATTLAVVAVFLPVAMVSGIIGRYFIEFGLTVACSMIVSLFVSFTLVPLMSCRLVKDEDPVLERKSHKNIFVNFLDWFNDTFDKCALFYGKALGKVLKVRFIIVVLAIGFFVYSVMLIPTLGFSFMPSTDNGEFNITTNLDSGLTLEMATRKANEIQNIISKNKEVLHTYISLKKDSISIYVRLCDKNERILGVHEICNRIRSELNNIPGTENIVIPVAMGPAGNKDATYNITGENFDQLYAFAVTAMNYIKQDPHAVDVGINYKPGKPEATIQVDRDKAADLGVNTAGAADTIRTLYDGVVVSKFESGKDRYDVRVSMKDEQRRDLESLDGIYVSGSNNQMIPINQVTKKVFTSTSSVLHRYDRSGQIELSANVINMPSGDFLNQYLKKFNSDLKIPRGVKIGMGSMNQTMQEGFSSLVIALFMGILFLYLIMAAQFESFVDPISIMFALPLALIGAVFGLYISRNPLSIIALIGVIMLMGLVAKNAILLIDFTKQRRKEGKERNMALIEAGAVRLRPIMMTSLAMIFGMVPLTLATGAGTEMRAPMAYAVIGGLITSTLLTLFVVPVVYTLLDDLKRKKV